MIFAIVGPTASNKSLLADKLAEYLKDSVVINFDAYQIYIEMNKGTAKPDLDFLESHPNYKLFNFVHIDEPFDVSTYQEIGRKLLKENENKNIILVGGTGFYLKALLYDYKFIEEPQMDPNYLSDLSNEQLYERLYKLDQEDAIKITKNNRKRLIRALYVYDIHKKTKTQINENGKNKLLYDVAFIGICPEREILYKNIDNRVDKMIENGLIEEVNQIKRDFPNKNQALEAIGYKEFFKGISIDESIELIKKNTRHYAKRQLTYFRHQFENVIWFEDVESAFNYIRQKY